ncbi:MAG TPA: PQQ-binding-like beta-propeller repeat protein, partial [bacterium]
SLISPQGFGPLRETDDYTGQLLWQTGDPVGMCNDCAISPEGGYAALGISLNNQRAQLHEGQTGTLLWQYMAGEGATHVAISQNGEIFAFAYQHFLSIFHASSSNPIWTFDFGATAWAYNVAVTQNGSRIIAQSMVGEQGLIYSFSPSSSTPQWVQTFQQPVGFGWYGLRISADGTRVSSNGKYTAWVLNAATGAVIWSVDANNTESPVPLSGDGTLLAIGSNNAGTCKVYQWNNTSQTYELLWTYTFTGGISRWCSEVEISTDGNTVAAGSLEFITMNSYDGHAAVFDTWGGGTPLWISSSLGDLVGEIAMSDDGQVIAIGSWGDINNATPDLRVYERASATPFFTVNAPGSINSVDMTPDGATIFAGGKHVHNRIFGNGGDAYAISVAQTTVNVDITLTPINPPIIIPPGGGNFDYQISLTNTGSNPVNFDAWTMLQLPNLSWHGPFLGPVSLTLAGSASIARVRTQYIPARAPAGSYVYRGYVGDYPAKWDSSGFTFQKAGAGVSGLGAGEWPNVGEEFSESDRAFITQQSSLMASVSPNPFNPTTVASFELREASYVRLQVYDTAGREVANWVDGWRDAGVHQVVFDGTALPSGVYLYRLTAGDLEASGKLVLMK